MSDDLIVRVNRIIQYLDARPHGAAPRPDIDERFGPGAATILTQLVSLVERERKR